MMCNFMYHTGNEEFMNACETMLKTVCMLYENQTHKHDDDVLTHRLNTFKQELIESMSKQKIDTSDIFFSYKYFYEKNILIRRINSVLYNGF